MNSYRPFRLHGLLLLIGLLAGTVNCGKAAPTSPPKEPLADDAASSPARPDATSVETSVVTPPPGSKPAGPKPVTGSTSAPVDDTAAKALYASILKGSPVVSLTDGSTGECAALDTKSAEASRRLFALSANEKCAAPGRSVDALVELLKDGRQPERTAEILKLADACGEIQRDLTAALADSALCSPWTVDKRGSALDLGKSMTLGKALTLITFEKARRGGAAKAMNFVLDILEFAQRVGRGDSTLLQALTLGRLAKGPLALAKAAQTATPLSAEARKALSIRLRGILNKNNHVGHITRGEFAVAWRNVQESMTSGSASIPVPLGLSPATNRTVLHTVGVAQQDTVNLCPLDKPDKPCLERLVKHFEGLRKDKLAAFNALSAMVGPNPSPEDLSKADRNKLIPLATRMLSGSMSSLGRIYGQLGDSRRELELLAAELAK